MAPHESSPLLPATAVRLQNRRRRALFVAVPVCVVLLVLLSWYAAASSHRRAQAQSAGSAAQKSTPEPEEKPEPEAKLTDEQLLTLTPPFVSKLHPIPPRLVALPGRAIPTNAFWTNFLVGDGHGLNYGAGQVTLSPYTVRSVPKRLEVSYGDVRRVATKDDVTEYFNVDAAFAGYSAAVDQGNSSTALLGDGNSTIRDVEAFDSLSVTVKYHFGSDPDQWMKALLVRGAPFVTVEYQRVIPVLEFNATVLSVNGERVEDKDPDAPAAELQQWTSQRFELDVLVYGASGENATAPDDSVPAGLARQKWLLYFGEPRTLRLQFANEKDYRPYNFRGELTTPTNVRLVDSNFYSGAARLAVVPNGDKTEETIRLLDGAAHIYPVSSTLDFSVVDAENNQARGDVSFCWTTAKFRPVVTGASQDLLMLANPHHVATFADEASFEVLSKLGFRTLKSYMTAVRGSCWRLTEQLPTTTFDAADDSSMAPVPDRLKGEIAAALVLDSNYTPEAQDPYYFGKEIARQVRLALIADKLGDVTARDSLIDQVEEWVTPWLVGGNGDHFVYERSWGGLCSLNGLKGVFWMTDFGNGWYNDHVRLPSLAAHKLCTEVLTNCCVDGCSTSTTATSCTQWLSSPSSVPSLPRPTVPLL